MFATVFSALRDPLRRRPSLTDKILPVSNVEERKPEYAMSVEKIEDSVPNKSQDQDQPPLPKLVSLRKYLKLAMMDASEAQKLIDSRPESTQMLLAEKIPLNLWQVRNGVLHHPSKLGHIYWFSNMILQTQGSGLIKELVICTGHDAEVITTCALLIGGFLILHEDETAENVAAAFQPISSLFKDFQDPSLRADQDISVFDCWRALSSGKRLGWVNLTSSDPDCENCIDIEEYLHYDSPANGDLHVIVPSKLLAFQCPIDIPCEDEEEPSSTLWLDNDGERRFSPAYYADIFDDFDVQLVVRSCPPTSYDASPFADAGIAVEELDADRQQPSQLLRRTDRFLTLCTLASGVIAVHGGLGGTGSAELLISAFLMRHHGFKAKDAIAWVRMLHPGFPVTALQFSNPLRRRDNKPRRTRRHSIHETSPAVLSQARARAAAATAAAAAAVTESISQAVRDSGTTTRQGRLGPDPATVDRVIAAGTAPPRAAGRRMSEYDMGHRSGDGGEAQEGSVPLLVPHSAAAAAAAAGVAAAGHGAAAAAAGPAQSPMRLMRGMSSRRFRASCRDLTTSAAARGAALTSVQRCSSVRAAAAVAGGLGGGSDVISPATDRLPAAGAGSAGGGGAAAGAQLPRSSSAPSLGR